MKPYLKNSKSNKGWGWGSSGRGLPSKNEALSSNLILPKIVLMK
jgi:hypothetical protein